MKKHLWSLLAASLFVTSTCFIATTAAQPPAGGGAAKQGKKSKKKAVEEKDPVVLAIRESNPQTAQELLKAVQVMTNIKRIDEGKKYLSRLIGRNLNPQQMATLQRRFGSSFFFKLLRNPDYAPEGADFAKAVMKASYEAARDPARLQQLITQLTDSDRDIRAKALVALQDGREPAVVALISALKAAANSTDAGAMKQSAAIRGALNYLKRTAEQPMLASMSANDPKFLVQVVRVLHTMKSRDAIPLLLFPATAPASSAELKKASQAALVTLIGGRVKQQEAQQYLYRQAVKAFRHSLPGPKESDADSTISWDWDRAKNTVQVRFEPKRVARIVAAYRLARDAHRLDPKDQHAKTLYISSLLELAKVRNGLGKKLPRGKNSAFAEATALGIPGIVTALEYCQGRRHIPGALAATEILGEIGDESLLFGKTGSITPLAMAAQDKDRRLRYRAAISIVQLNPQESFSGASHVTDVLGSLIETRGKRRALVAHPKINQAQTIVGMLNELGYVADKATTARMIYRMATRSQDYDVIFVSDMVNTPRVEELAQMIRRDVRTGSIPLGIFASDRTYRRLEIRTEKDRLTQILAMPNSVKSMQQQVQLLLRMAGRSAISPDERILQAMDALDAVAKLAASPTDVFELRRIEDAVVHALYVPQLCTKSAGVLARWASPAAQQALLNLATDENRALANRQAAATGFAAAVKARGLVITSSDLSLANRRIQRATKLDPQSQRVVKTIMSTLSSVTSSKSKRLGAAAGRKP